MTNARWIASLLFALAVLPAPSQLEAQGIGARIKKKAAEAVKGKDPKKNQANDEKKDDGPITSRWEQENCGPLTPEKVSDFLRGLQTEMTSRKEFNSMIQSLRSKEQVVACRNAEVMSPAVQKIMMQGITKGATNAQLQRAMEKNTADAQAHMDKKCGKDPSQFNQVDAYRNARREGTKAAGLSDECYDKMTEVTLAFCKLSPAEQQTAVQDGIRVPGKGSGEWVYTAAEAKAISRHCGELVPLIEALGSKLG